MDARVKVLIGWLGMASVFSSYGDAQAEELVLANYPLFLGSGVDPNVLLIVDDTVSMDRDIRPPDRYYPYSAYWADNGVAREANGRWISYYSRHGKVEPARVYSHMFVSDDNVLTGDPVAQDQPESLNADWRVRSHDFNASYYDPDLTYSAPGGDADPSVAEGKVFEVWIDDHGYLTSGPAGPATATYPADIFGNPAGNGEVDLWDSHIRYSFVKGPGSRWEMDVTTFTTSRDIAALKGICTYADAQNNYQRCFGTTWPGSRRIGFAETTGFFDRLTDMDGNLVETARTPADEARNFANWYVHYRKPRYATRNGIIDFVQAGSNFRFGMMMLNDEKPGGGLRHFGFPADDDYASHNAALVSALRKYHWLDTEQTSHRHALFTAGKILRDQAQNVCQQSHALLLTDDFWNDAFPDSRVGEASVGDQDGDGLGDTYADIASYYHAAVGNPHFRDDGTTAPLAMTSSAVVFDARGRLQGIPEDDSRWGNPLVEEEARIDDLRHAASNTRGHFFNDMDALSLVYSVRSSLHTIARIANASAASVATNSGSVSHASKLFQARFSNTPDWSGQVLALNIHDAGILSLDSRKAVTESDYLWDARKELQSLQNRNVITRSAGAGVPFRFDNLDEGQQRSLLGPLHGNQTDTDGNGLPDSIEHGRALVSFLRGETSGAPFRDRRWLLGDIVNSSPVYVGPPRAGYPDSISPGDVSYSQFRHEHESRPGMIYVGANDGMLHGFAEEDGAEELAYIPGPVYAKLAELGDPDYGHQFYVDASPVAVDAFFTRENRWRTVLAGGLGAGGKGIYALDITDPQTGFSEVRADSISLWEFSSEDDGDMGFSFGQPSIVKTADADDVWGVVFGNGYGSASGKAVLYVLNVEDGTPLVKFVVDDGSDGPNGLSTPTVVDIDDDFIADFAYAGDLKGNVWKFDLRGRREDWKVGYRLFSTRTDIDENSGEIRHIQPITTRVQVTQHPSGERFGHMVFFGTGKYLEQSDASPAGSPTQAFYGIVDAGIPVTDASTLLKQEILSQDSYPVSDSTGFSDLLDANGDGRVIVRTVSNHRAGERHTFTGWYMELAPMQINHYSDPDSPDPARSIDNHVDGPTPGFVENFGERQVSDAVVRDGRVIFSTLLPSLDPCASGGTSFVMNLDYRDGSVLDFPAFDLSGDGEFDRSDGQVAGLSSEAGIAPGVDVLTDGDAEVMLVSGSSGLVEATRINPGAAAYGRQSWNKIK